MKTIKSTSTAFNKWGSLSDNRISIRFITITTAAMSLFFLFSAAKALSNYGLEEQKMAGQVFPEHAVFYLTRVNTGFQILTGLALLISIPLVNLRFYSSIAAVSLMAIYTAYTEMVLLHTFSKIPCACIYIIDNISWEKAFLLNLSFLSMTVVLLFLNAKERRFVTKSWS